MPGAPLNRGAIFRRFPWLQQHNQRIIISADVDGLLSAAFLHHHLGWQVAGYYDGTALWLAPEALPHRRQLVWVGLDVVIPASYAVGHHILMLGNTTPAPLAHICNPNLLASVGANHFARKYPFSTILFLLWLHNVPLRRSLMARLLVLHADSSWLTAARYADNCREWHERLPDYNWSWLFHQVGSAQFQRRMEDQLYVRLDRLGGSLPTGNRQLRFNPDWDEDIILGLYGLAGTHLKWSPPKAPVIVQRIEGQRETASLKGLSAQEFAHRYLSGEIFSFAITSRDSINFTRLNLTAAGGEPHAGKTA